jgi:hypothetical protein
MQQMMTPPAVIAVTIAKGAMRAWVLMMMTCKEGSQLHSRKGKKMGKALGTVATVVAAGG